MEAELELMMMGAWIQGDRTNLLMRVRVGNGFEILKSNGCSRLPGMIRRYATSAPLDVPGTSYWYLLSERRTAIRNQAYL